MKHWVASPYVTIDPGVVRAFANSVSSSRFMMEKANEVVAAINVKVSLFIHAFLDLRSQRFMQTDECPLLSASESPTTVTALLHNTSEQMAAALTALEGVMYSRIRPADYISHLRELQGSDRVADASLTNHKITFWVMQKVLRSDLIERRGKAFKFFLKTAEVRASPFLGGNSSSS